MKLQVLFGFLKQRQNLKMASAANCDAALRVKTLSYTKGYMYGIKLKIKYSFIQY